MAYRLPGVNNYNGRIDSNGDTINSATSQSYRGRTQEPREIDTSKSQTQRATSPSQILISASNTTISGTTNIVFDSLDQINEWISGGFSRTDNILPNDIKIGQVFLLKENTPDQWVTSLPLEPFDLTTKQSPTFQPIKAELQNDGIISEINIMKNEINSLELVVESILDAIAGPVNGTKVFTQIDEPVEKAVGTVWFKITN